MNPYGLTPQPADAEIKAARMGMATYSSGQMPFEPGAIMSDEEIEAMDRKVREAYERKPWVPISLERAKSDAEMSRAFLDSQAGSLADQIAAASGSETWARIVAGAILVGLAALAWWLA